MDKIQNILDKPTNNKTVFGTVLHIEHENGKVIFSGGSGNLNKDSQYYIASTTKLYTVAMIMKLRAEKKLNLEDTLSKFFPEEIYKGLNTYQGPDHSADITIEQLLSHTSGIPDYFSGKDNNGICLSDELTKGNDRKWSFDDALAIARNSKSTFAPGQDKKALYSDTNFQLLGRIIELLRKDSIEQIFQKEIFAPLKLTHTYMYEGLPDQKPMEMYFKDKELLIPKAMESVRADGGIVSTAGEAAIFLKQFFDGYFFPKEYFRQMRAEYRSVMFPLKYGIGIMRYKLPRLFTMFRDIPEMIGHSGLSGAFEYYCPEKNIYLTGTVNQISNPSISYRILATILMSLK
jgi:CubicO group peptidase (beta-lactamase class C family)